ncbi:MAG TPA: HIT domain-containing protein [Patescibacteria group bacterium]|nr:HIT domain-containing protein [Patescibacteria group bacterium]
MKRLWAPWRMTWITASKAPIAGCVFCSARDGQDDRASLLLQRSEHAFLILNSFPYAPGHLMAVIKRHTGALVEAGVAELSDAMQLVQRAVTALTAEYRPDGFNVGLNQGRAAGAGIDDHLHIHVVPRWSGDSNFISVLDDTRVLPETLERTWERVRGRLGG